MRADEWQFDGLVGPTHNYAGLAIGNLAAQGNAGAASNPRMAALQGLEKMRFVSGLGVKQAFLPPHYRPFVQELRRLGFGGEAAHVLKQAADYSPTLLAAIYSSSFMWTANAATIAPSCDTADGRIHITPANMASHYHRGIESDFTTRSLQKIFHNKEFFAVHNALYAHSYFGDEGAANHMVMNDHHGDQGTHVFVYGESTTESSRPGRYPARQNRMASEAVARLHQLNKNHCLYLQQSPEVIDQGVFHNDVIAMNTTRRMIPHEKSFANKDQEALRAFAAKRPTLRYREVSASELSVSEAVSTYFFNSELLDLGGDRFALIAPGECEAHARARALLDRLIGEGVLREVHYRDLRESMRNGGGPACLRLRVVMTEREAAAIHPGVILTEARHHALTEWVKTHYRDRLAPEDLRDPSLLAELERAYLALEAIIEMPGFYSDFLS